MKRNGNSNPFDIYAKVLKYNIDTLNRIVDVNEIFLKNFTHVLSNWSNGAKEDILDEELRADKISVLHETVSDDWLPIEDELHIHPPLVHDISEIGDETEDLNLALMYDRPINMMDTIASENVERLNLFGIHTINDLNENNTSEISQNTGIPKSHLKDLIKQVQ